MRFSFFNYCRSLITSLSTKRLIAAWRVLVGVWAPKRWDLSLPALAQYSTPRVPPENQWIDRSKIKTPSPTTSPRPANAELPRSRKRPPSRKLIRHVLRARGEAARALARLLSELEQPTTPPKRVRASTHLVRAYGGTVDDLSGPTEAAESVLAELEPKGWRSAVEVMAFLRSRGAKIKALEHRVEGDWAALSSEGEGSGWESDANGGSIVWVPSGAGTEDE